MSDLGMRMYGFELGRVVALYDRRALDSLNAAQRKAQVHARERLQHHARRAVRIAEQDPELDPQCRAALEAVADLMDLLCQHVREDVESTPALPGPRVRGLLEAPAELWAPQPAAPMPAPAPSAALRPDPEPAPDWSGPVVCRQCGLRLERTDLAAAMNRPINQGWRHLDSRKTHFPDPVPLSAASTP